MRTRVLEDLGESVVDRDRALRERSTYTYFGGHAYRDDDLYLGGSHSLVARHLCAVKPFDDCDLTLPSFPNRLSRFSNSHHFYSILC